MSEGMEFLRDELAALKAAGLYRGQRVVAGPQGAHLTVDGREVIGFCSNNYLGLAADPRVQRAAAEAIEQDGTGTGASRLLSGTMPRHVELEAALARSKGTEAALVFPTGYMANVGAISALVGREDLVLMDRLNHASLIDGCRLSGARMRVYPHRDVARLDRLLQRADGFRRRLVITDSVFSMDGDVAPLPEILDVTRRRDALLMVDDAHGTGVLGRTGRGILEHFGLEGRVPIVMGTLSKALGSLGGFIAGSQDLIDYLRNRARAFIYTTGLPTACGAAALTALRILEEEPSRLEQLRANSRAVRQGLRELGLTSRDDPTPIIPVVFGRVERAAAAAEHLWQNGILAPAIRPPTVPQEESRLRLSVMATHSPEDIQRLLRALRSLQ